MRSLNLVFMSLLVLLSASAVRSDGVIKVDPNTPAAVAAKAEPIIEKDPRLDQKVTYSGGYKRLHAVTDELSQMTGVTIYSGLSSKNWQVRDIPMVVCVKDLPLGKVLRAIADAAHLRLSSRKIEDQGKVTWTYRLSRSVKEEIEIDTVLEKKHDSELAVSGWAWDAMRAYGQQPKRSDTNDFIYSTGRLLASLGDSAKEDVFNSEVITFKGSDSKYRDIMREIYSMLWNDYAASLQKEGQVSEPPLDADFQHAALDVKLMDDGSAGVAYIDCCIGPICSRTETGGGVYALNIPLEDLAEHLRGLKYLNLPPYPEETPTASLEEDMADTSMSLLSTDEHWNRPALNEKLDLHKPDDEKVVLADLIEALSKASGMNIVCEDFTSHRQYGLQQKISELYAKDITLSKALKGTDYTWFVNDEDRLLVGWAWAFDNKWRMNHRSLVPESYLFYLQNKLDNEGLDIDDFAGCTALTKNQFYAWIKCSRCFTTLDQAWPKDVAVWKLYNQLTPEDKTLAKSPQGLPLAALNQEWVKNALQEERKLNRPSGQVWRSEEDEQKLAEETAVKQQVIDDPSLMPTMVLRLIRQPADYYPVVKSGMFTLDRVPEGINLSQYKLEIEYGSDQREYIFFKGPNLAFPAYSPERMVEIMKESKIK